MTMTKGEIQVRGILRGLNTETILRDVRAAFPNDTTAGTEGTVRWYRSHVRRIQAGKPPKLSAGLVSLIRQGATAGWWEVAAERSRSTEHSIRKPTPSYIGLIRKEHDSDFAVDFPDFPGCVSAGTTIEEARRMAQEALEMHVAGMIEDGENLPEPSTLDAIMTDPDNVDAVAFLATLPEPTERVRVNIILPVQLLRLIDARAANRSAFLARAAEKALSED
jgi:predicted RNase H-like HicB family nuclease